MRLIFIFPLVFSFTAVFSQDIIVKKNGDALSVKVTEIGMHEIKFKTSAAPDSPVITISRDDVKTLKVGNETIIEGHL